MPEKGWQRRFDDPIPLPDGGELVTLEDAGNYITKLPKAEHEAPEWQAAMQALLLVATSGGPTMLARIGIMQALHRHEIRKFDTDRKPPSLGKTQASEGSMTEAASTNWSREFDEPIALPDGGELRTLLDAGRYVDALPRSMHEREEWQAVMEVLLSAVEGREPVRLAQVVPNSGLAGEQTDEGTTTQAGEEIASQR
jgi:hypothetical protein